MTGDTDDRIPVVVAPSGRLDAAAAPALKQALAGALGGEAPLVIVSMADASYASSAALRVLLAAHKQAQRGGGRMIICCLQPQVQSVLHMVGFDQVLTVTGTLAEAQQSLRSPKPPTTTGKGQP